jgi:hypothetical protein
MSVRPVWQIDVDFHQHSQFWVGDPLSYFYFFYKGFTCFETRLPIKIRIRLRLVCSCQNSIMQHPLALC